MSTDNLLSLKDDMVAFIAGHGMHRLPGYVTEDIPSILWEGAGNPDAWKWPSTSALRSLPSAK
jgi:hypothetical protein